LDFNLLSIIADEGHLLLNEKTKIYSAMNQIPTRRRILLTGSPLQNNLMEFFNMVEFVNPGLLGTRAEFKKNFVEGLEKGLSLDSTQAEVQSMKRRSCILHKILDGNYSFSLRIIGCFYQFHPFLKRYHTTSQ
jgi:transcriptional regulator ATRX